MMGVVGIVADGPCCSVGGMAHVASGVRPQCTRSLTLRPRLGRGVNCARGWGSFGMGDYARSPGLGRGRACVRGQEARARRSLRPRPRGRARRSRRPRPRGRARRSRRPRPRGSGEKESAPEARGLGRDGVCA